MVSLGVRTGRVQSFGQFTFRVRTELEPCRPDDRCLTSGQALASSFGRLLYIVQTRATYLLLSEAANVRTSSLHRPDGDPIATIKTPDHFLYPTKSGSWLLVSY
jgi:hypothetical protein